eukprot:1403931-Prymnesium_polylepis.1
MPSAGGMHYGSDAPDRGPPRVAAWCGGLWPAARVARAPLRAPGRTWCTWRTVGSLPPGPLS